jgi:dGTPase
LVIRFETTVPLTDEQSSAFRYNRNMPELPAHASPPGHPQTLFSLKQREAALLAPYAVHSCDTEGRKYDERSHPYRGPYQRDRDRILHSAAFRRLSGKMQVFTGERGDYHRTRLTHTMEVTSIARTIGRTLRLNEDLIEALALMHDIGHPPFGHAGEDALDECLQDEGGFSHNQFALTLVEELEQRYHGFPGLNLSSEVLAGQRCRVDKARRRQSPLLEMQVVDMADSIAYDAHDVDDAVKLGLITIDELAQVELTADAMRQVRDRTGALPPSDLRPAIVHQVIDQLVTSTLHHSQAFLETAGWETAAQAQTVKPVVRPTDETHRAKRGLEKFLYQCVYRHPDLLAVRKAAQNRLKEMIGIYCDSPEQMPKSYRERRELVGSRRSAAEYIAGMTDRFCEERYRALFGDGKSVQTSHS